MGRRGLAWSVSGWGQVKSYCECGNEPVGSINAAKPWSGYTTDGQSSSAQLH
jgi:hypothetical protein